MPGTYLHDGGSVNGGCSECLRIAGEQTKEANDKKEREEQERKEQELIKKFNEETLSNSDDKKEETLGSSPAQNANSDSNGGAEHHEDPNGPEISGETLGAPGTINNPSFARSYDSKPALKNLSQSMTGTSLNLGVATAIGCIVGEFSPEPISKAAGIGVCCMGSLATATTALTGHILEPRETEKPRN
jgi:hypothetical protein